MNDVALELIKNIKIDPSHINTYNETALIFACKNKMNNVALALIKTGKSNPSYINIYNKTALIIACENKMNDIALELIKTGESNPSYVNRNKCTALTFACKNNMNNIALELIKLENPFYSYTEEYNNSKQVDKSNYLMFNPNYNLFVYAYKNKMNNILLSLFRIIKSKCMDNIYDFFRIFDMKKLHYFIYLLIENDEIFLNSIILQEYILKNKEIKRIFNKNYTIIKLILKLTETIDEIKLCLNKNILIIQNFFRDKLKTRLISNINLTKDYF